MKYSLLILISLLGFAQTTHNKSRIKAENLRKELPIVVIIPSYNNKNWYERNLESVLSQQYSNYKVKYIDDCSPDGTGKLVERYINTHPKGHHVHLIRNSVRQGALYNIYHAIYQCHDDDIIVLLDGDDWLLGEDVFKLLNTIYTKKDVWITHGTFAHYPNLKDRSWSIPIPKDIVKRNAFRAYRCPSHLRTFYAWLFKKIMIQDLQDEKGIFFSMTWDQAMLFPMFEMAGDRHYFVEKPVYAYNIANPINDNKVNAQLQRDLEALLRAQPCYKHLCNQHDTPTQG